MQLRAHVIIAISILIFVSKFETEIRKIKIMLNRSIGYSYEWKFCECDFSCQQRKIILSSRKCYFFFKQILH